MTLSSLLLSDLRRQRLLVRDHRRQPARVWQPWRRGRLLRPRRGIDLEQSARLALFRRHAHRERGRLCRVLPELEASDNAFGLRGRLCRKRGGREGVGNDYGHILFNSQRDRGV